MPINASATATATATTIYPKGTASPSRAESAAIAIRNSDMNKQLEPVGRDLEKMSGAINAIVQKLATVPPGVTATVTVTVTLSGTTGAGSAALGANCPAVTPAAPFKWVSATLDTGETVYFPCWK